MRKLEKQTSKEVLENMHHLITVRPGPTLHVWGNGTIIVEIKLEKNAALVLCSDLLKQMGRL